MVIIITLKFNSEVSLGHGLIGLTWVNIRIKIIIIIILKPDSRIDRGKVKVADQEG
jgi:hypothetical protein